MKSPSLSHPSSKAFLRSTFCKLGLALGNAVDRFLMSLSHLGYRLDRHFNSSPEALDDASLALRHDFAQRRDTWHDTEVGKSQTQTRALHNLSLLSRLRGHVQNAVNGDTAFRFGCSC